MISAAILGALLERCAPTMDKRVAAAIVEVESYGDSWAIDDDSARRSYHPRSYAEAVSLAHDLAGERHVFDLGLGQVNSVHLGEPGLSIETMLRPCSNLAAAQRIFSEALVATGDLRAALVRYNGSGSTSPRYADLVLGAMRSPFVAAVTVSPNVSAVSVRVAQPVEIIRRVGSSFGGVL
jgi:hypothetical protein